MPQIRKLPIHLLLAVVVTITAAFGLASSARAVEFENDGVVQAGEVIDDDLFMASDQVVISGTINGNLFASGNQIFIDGAVNGDLIVTGADVTVKGPVAGNLVFAGRMLNLDSQVEGSVFAAGSEIVLGPQAAIQYNLFFTGFGLRAQPGSSIGRDAAIAGYQALLKGSIARDMNASVVALELSGDVGRNLLIEVDAPDNGGFPFVWPGMTVPVAPGLRVSEGAVIGGKLSYVSPVEQAQAIAIAPVEGVFYEPSPDPTLVVQVDFASLLRNTLLERLRDLITLMVLGALVLWAFPTFLDQAGQKIKPILPAGLWGLLALGLGYLLAFVVALTVLILGILLSVATLHGLSNIIFGVGFSTTGLAFAAFSLMVSYGSKLVVAYLVGRWAFGRLSSHSAAQPFWVLLLGVLIYLLLRSIPLLGPIIGFTATVVGLGAIWLTLRTRFTSAQVPARAPVQVAI